MKKNRYFALKFLFFAFYISVYIIPLSAQTSFARGEELFIQNKPLEALIFLETAVTEDAAHVQAFLYLGIAYQQLNRVDDAIATFTGILPRGGRETARIAFNLGNAYFSKGEHELASQSYSQALQANPSFSAALLNRANSKIQMRELNEAIDDYEMYLAIEPNSLQRGRIEQLITFIREEAAAEEQRIQEERAAEERRIEAERVAEERRREEARIAEERRLEEERVAEERRREEERVAAENRRIAMEEAARIEREEAEARRIAAEEAARKEREAAEARRLAMEEAARLERERRQRLLDEVAASLQAAAEDARGLSAGVEDIEGYEGEFELE